MKRSLDRVLVTHVGSLPRPDDLLEMMQAKQQGRPFDEKAYAARLRDAVVEIVRKQVELGLDIVDDGEFGKPSFLTYVNDRLGGFEPGGPRGSPWAGSREVRSFPEYYEWATKQAASPAVKQHQMVCTGPIAYKGQKQLQRDIENLKAALKDEKIEDVFMPAISPSNVEDWYRNEHYKTDEEYLFAIATAMGEEYKAIVDAGFLVQIDDPRLVTYYNTRPDASIEDCRKWARIRIDALNHALRGIPEEKIRFHTCYGINFGPRVHDMELKDIVDLILKVRAGAYSFEAANPRHEHEWRVWEHVELPKGKLLIPGVITQSSVLVEHPELVAERILRFARLVGRENVIAGADCGFGTFAGSMEIHPTIVWAKLKALSEGARIATKELWGRA